MIIVKSKTYHLHNMYLYINFDHESSWVPSRRCGEPCVWRDSLVTKTQQQQGANVEIAWNTHYERKSQNSLSVTEAIGAKFYFWKAWSSRWLDKQAIQCRYLISGFFSKSTTPEILKYCNHQIYKSTFFVHCINVFYFAHSWFFAAVFSGEPSLNMHPISRHRQHMHMKKGRGRGLIQHISSHRKRYVCSSSFCRLRWSATCTCWLDWLPYPTSFSRAIWLVLTILLCHIA